MIKLQYMIYGSLVERVKIFKGDTCFDDFLYWFFDNDIHNYKFLEGKEYILGEIRQKGINNK